MHRRFVRFIRGLSTNWTGLLGVVITNTAFFLFLLLELLRLLGLVTNAYVGLITYMTLPALFVLGLLLIPLGWRRYKKATGKSTRELLADRFPRDMVEPRLGGSQIVLIIGALTVTNIVFLGAGGARMLHFMDEPRFCGTACHSVMSPEWTTYQDSPHAHVKCVECHVGEGADALIDSKLNGLWQIISVTLDLYEKPIPTPVHQLRPARETCEKCHWPDKFYGDRIEVHRSYANDRESTPSYTTLALKIGSGSGESRGEIHWHIAEHNRVRYASVDDEREEMIWVEVRRQDGTFHRYANRALIDERSDFSNIRVMDCVDCHNRATHIYEDPARAVDARIARGQIDRSLPFARKAALAALTGNYASTPDAVGSVADDFIGFYRRKYPKVAKAEQPAIDRAIDALQKAYSRNIHPGMNVDWGVYPDLSGHRRGGGCFRCHTPELVDERGEAISSECTLCHAILAYESAEPFQFLQPPNENDRLHPMHEYLRSDFLGSIPSARQAPPATD